MLFMLLASKKKSESEASTKLENNLMNADSSKFWRLWKSCYKSPSAADMYCVNKLNDNVDIANCFAENIKNTCVPNDVNKHNVFREQYIHRKKSYTGPADSFSIDVELVSKSVNKMAINKASGFDCVTVEHVKFAHPSLIVILSQLFNIMLLIGCVPDDFGVGITTPIPKFKGNKKNIVADDFRGITICPVISKIFEYCILGNFSCIKTSDRQFGFKEGVGTLDSIHTVRKVIKFFNTKQLTCNVGTIDLKKAFDKINKFGMLNVLFDNFVDKRIINVIENWSNKTTTAIKWGNAFSERTPLLSGIRQGGILSPLLFSLFVDTVLKKLEKSTLGCYINFACYNSFMYADDIILLTTSVTDLQQLFNLCNTLFCELDLPINIAKCQCMRIGPRHNIHCASVSIGEVKLAWVNDIRFLGVTICKAKKFTCSWSEAKRKFYYSSNVILSKLGCSPANVLLKLMYAQGVQYLLYGISATSLSSSEISSLTFVYNSIFAKIFKTTDRNVILCCQFYSGYLDMNRLYELQRYKFLLKSVKNGTISCNDPLDRLDYDEFVKMQCKYNIFYSDSDYIISKKVWAHFEKQIIIP